MASYTGTVIRWQGKAGSVRADAGSGLESRLVDSKASVKAGGAGDSKVSASSPGSKAGQDSSRRRSEKQAAKSNLHRALSKRVRTLTKANCRV
ncbi:MAG: hypothetical protein R3C24_04325 [Cyanobacteriota/Melainabacteria group bacterium]